MQTIKVRLNERTKDSGIQKLTKIVEAEFLEDRGHSVKVRLPDGNVIVRKKPHQVVED